MRAPVTSETVTDPALATVPAGTVTLTVPVVAPAGIRAVIRVALSIVNVVDVPLNVTAVAPVKPFPVIVMPVPGTPLVGASEETASKVKSCGACTLAVPFQTVT